MAYKLDKIRKDRLKEIDGILDSFQGKLGLDDILNQDYSLITDLAEVRNAKIEQLLEEQKKAAPPNKGTVADQYAKVGT